jgi:opacity protein-like surface antigen
MKRLISHFLTAGIGVALLATPAVAQGGLMLGGGLTLPQGDFKDAAKSGFHGMAAFDFGAPMVPLGIRLDASYHVNQFKAPGDPDAAFDILALSGDLSYSFPSIGAKPYAIGGVTWASVKCGGNDCLSTSSTSDMGFNVGGGVRFSSLFVEARYVSIGGDLDMKFVPLTVGFHF